MRTPAYERRSHRSGRTDGARMIGLALDVTAEEVWRAAACGPLPGSVRNEHGPGPHFAVP
ncbi:hypothetical protein GCM10014715_57950 [Streptomyces spiralis]|uniref:Uncharacterized protein n=1 Tax=Streptomyces spiralis TaxID=66376 RepID=A0A919DZI6_9ACTN|nr:hypothetical protein GCM10014715_57950 [Streptomyces spiralis]